MVFERKLKGGLSGYANYLKILLVIDSSWSLIHRIKPSENLSDSIGASSIFYENLSSLIPDI